MQPRRNDDESRTNNSRRRGGLPPPDETSRPNVNESKPTYRAAVLSMPPPAALVDNSSHFVPTISRSIQLEPRQRAVEDELTKEKKAKGAIAFEYGQNPYAYIGPQPEKPFVLPGRTNADGTRYFKRHSDHKPIASTIRQKPKNESWRKPVLEKLHQFFPLERTNRRIRLDECSLEELCKRLSDCFRIMSIQAKYRDRPASAALLTPENVELYLAIWDAGDGKEVIVEVQRRRGDSVISYGYCHHILDAASGEFDPSDISNEESSLLYLQATEKKLKMELSRLAPGQGTGKETIVALEIVYDLLKKERRDARRLGMESMCVLANARKSVLAAAIHTSCALLLGDQSAISQGLHEILLGILQKREIGDEEIMDEYPEDSDDENCFLDEDDAIQCRSPEYKEEITLLFNLALDALAHALEVVTTFGIGTTGGLDTLASAGAVVDTFLVDARQRTGIDMLTTLLEAVRKAHLKPHNAWLAAKCLRFICKASQDASKRTVSLGGTKVVEDAFDLGVESHAKLETECRLLQEVLIV